MAALANTMQGLLTLVVTKSLHLATMCIYQVLYTVCGVFGPWIMKRGDPTSKRYCEALEEWAFWHWGSGRGGAFRWKLITWILSLFTQAQNVFLRICKWASNFKLLIILAVTNASRKLWSHLYVSPSRASQKTRPLESKWLIDWVKRLRQLLYRDIASLYMNVNPIKIIIRRFKQCQGVQDLPVMS